MTASPPNISLADFVNFVSTSGAPKMTIVKNAKYRGAYDPKTDFYKRLRGEICKYHQGGKNNLQDLDDIVIGLTDKKKITSYPPLISSYKSFLGKKPVPFFVPPSDQWSFNGLTVRVNPELGLALKGSHHIIKMHFRQVPLSKQKSELALLLMSHVLGAQNTQGANFSILDVPNGKLITTPNPSIALLPLMQGEATNFMTIWNSI